jgi:hypothetical protein
MIIIAMEDSMKTYSTTPDNREEAERRLIEAGLMQPEYDTTSFWGFLDQAIPEDHNAHCVSRGGWHLLQSGGVNDPCD